MSIDIWTDSMQHAELFGKPVLFTNWLVQRDTIPQPDPEQDEQGFGMSMTM